MYFKKLDAEYGPITLDAAVSDIHKKCDAYFSEETNGVGGSVNMFLLPDLSPEVGSEAVLLTKRRNAVFDGVTTIYFDDTSLLLGRHKVTPLKSWDK